MSSSTTAAAVGFVIACGVALAVYMMRGKTVTRTVVIDGNHMDDGAGNSQPVI